MRVLHALRERLLEQDLFEEFRDEFTREMNRLRMEHHANLSSAERAIERIEARRKELVESIMEGALRIELKGNLAAMLSAATNAKRSPETGDLSLQVEMVAGLATR